MKHWTLTFRVQPPDHVVSARNGSSVFFAGYSRVLKQWYGVYPGGEEKIDMPEMVYLDQEYVDAHKRDLSLSARRPTIRLRESKKPPVQMQLAM
jgi:hypothetical protein